MRLIQTAQHYPLMCSSRRFLAKRQKQKVQHGRQLGNLCPHVGLRQKRKDQPHRPSVLLTGRVVRMQPLIDQHDHRLKGFHLLEKFFGLDLG